MNVKRSLSPSELSLSFAYVLFFGQSRCVVVAIVLTSFVVFRGIINILVAVALGGSASPISLNHTNRALAFLTN